MRSPEAGYASEVIRPAIGATLRRRQAGCPAQTLARLWKAQQRLHATYTKLIMRLAVAHATIPPRRTAPTRRGRHRPAAGRRPGREACGAAPPASRLLRIADATALRAGLDTGASTAPQGRE